MADPWRDPERYKTGRLVKCLGCGFVCHKTHWGAWCYPCNVARIDRINGSFEEILSSMSSTLREGGK